MTRVNLWLLLHKSWKEDLKNSWKKPQISVDFSKYVIWLSTLMTLCISRHELDSLWSLSWHKNIITVQTLQGFPATGCLHSAFFFSLFLASWRACEILVFLPRAPQWKCQVLSNRPPANSLNFFFWWVVYHSEIRSKKIHLSCRQSLDIFKQAST